MKLIEFLVRLSKRTNKLIKNCQMALYSAASARLCACTKRTLCVRVCELWVARAEFIMMFSGARPCLKTWRAEMSSLTVTSEKLWHSKMSLFISRVRSLRKLRVHLQLLTRNNTVYIISHLCSGSIQRALLPADICYLVCVSNFFMLLLLSRYMAVECTTKKNTGNRLNTDKWQKKKNIQQFKSTCRQQKLQIKKTSQY